MSAGTATLRRASTSEDDKREIHLTPEVQRLRGAIEDFLIDARGIFGLYWDGLGGFYSNVQEVEKHRRQLQRSLPENADPDPWMFAIGWGTPEHGNKPDQYVSIGDFLKRNAKDGENCIRLAQMTLVFLFETWETIHRQKFADAIGCKTEMVLIPVMGDLRRLRHAILHCRGFVTADVKKHLEVLAVGEIGSRLVLDRPQMSAVIQAIMDGISEWVFSRYDVAKDAT